MRIDFDKSIKGGYLLRRWSFSVILESLWYTLILLIFSGVVAAVMVLIPTGYPTLNHAAALVLVVALWIWYGYGLSVMHRLTRIGNPMTKRALLTWLKQQFPHWYLHQETHQLWCFSDSSNNYLYVLITSDGIFANLYTLTRGGFPSPLTARANLKRVGKLREALELAQSRPAQP